MSGINLATPQDIIAAVPYLLGFQPDDSLVVIAVTARRVVTLLRYDLPDPVKVSDRDLTGELADRLTAVLALHKTDSVALLGYGNAGRARPVLIAAIARLADLLTIREALLVTDSRFWSLLSAEYCPPGGIEIDSAATLPAAQHRVRFRSLRQPRRPERDHRTPDGRPGPGDAYRSRPRQGEPAAGRHRRTGFPAPDPAPRPDSDGHSAERRRRR
jgi:Domain of unknown function (DUF4192)